MVDQTVAFPSEGESNVKVRAEGKRSKETKRIARHQGQEVKWDERKYGRRRGWYTL